MQGEIGDWVFSKEHRAEHVLLDGWRNILEIFQYGETWQSIYGDHVLEFVKEQLRAGDRKWRLDVNTLQMTQVHVKRMPKVAYVKTI